MQHIKKIVEWLVILGCGGIVLLVSVSAVLRYALGEGLMFSEDLSRYLMVFVVFLSAAIALDENQHIGITVLLSKLSDQSQLWMKLLSQLLTLGFLSIIGWQSAMILPAQFRVRVVTMPGVPLGLFYTAVPLGCLLMIFFLAPKLADTLTGIRHRFSDSENRFSFKELVPTIILAATLSGVMIPLLFGVSEEMVLVLLLVFFFALVLMGVPVAFAIGLAGVVFIMLLPQTSIRAVPTLVFGGVSPFALLAIPLFILTGLLVERSGILKDLVGFSDSIVGQFPGGLAQVTIVGSMFFACVCGVALASSAAIGAMMIPLMIQQGYGRKFSASVTASASIVGPIIPPSVGMIIYSNATGGKVSIGGLFLAGVIPGLLLGLGMMTLTYMIAKKRNYPVNEEKFSFSRCRTTGIKALPGMVIPAVILLGIVLGIFTPSEAGAMTAVYAFALGAFFTRKLTLKDLRHCLLETSKITAVVFMLLAGAKVVGFLLSIYQAPVRLTEMLQGFTTNGYAFIALSMLALLLLGFVLEGVATMVMLVPVLGPVAAAYGIDPYHFGLIFVMTIQLALITPPVALGLFIVSRLAEITLEEAVKDTWPYLILIFAIILLIALFPNLTLWLPRLAGYVQ